MTVFDILAKRNADKLRAVRADGASIRYHLRMDGSEAGAIDVFELFNGVSLAFNSIPQGTASWDDIEPLELQIDWCLRGRFQLDDGIRLGDGELAVHDERIRKRSMRFPAPLYTGFTIRITVGGSGGSLPPPLLRLRCPRAAAHGVERLQDLCARPLNEGSSRIVLGYRRTGTADAAASQSARTHLSCQRDPLSCPASRRLSAKKYYRIS